MSGKEIVLAIDAMGGDEAPRMVIRGANIARIRYPDLRFMFFGKRPDIEALLARFKKLKSVSSTHHTDEVVEDGDKPMKALRQRNASSMRLAIDAVSEGAAHGVISAGNSGALMVLARAALKTLPGIRRPAMGSIFPTVRGESFMLDLGANIDTDSTTLAQFAVMGEVFARNVLGVREPTVGLLNIGTEEHKGNETIRTAAAVLGDSKLPIKFHGFVEADDIAAGTVDVVATDGFAGNIALKSAEGTARLYTEYLKSAFRRSALSRAGYLLARPALRLLRERVDPRAYNGAMFLGVNGVVVKSHGGTDHKGFANAIGVAFDMVNQGVNPKITDDLARLSLGVLPEPKRAAL